MSIEDRKAANDNFTPAELRSRKLERNKSTLQDFGDYVNTVREWIQEKRQEMDSADEHPFEADREEVVAALSALEQAMNRADTDTDNAESQPESDRLLSAANTSYSLLIVAFEEAKQFVDDE